MKETEVKLRKAIYELFRVVRMNAYMKKAQSEISELLDGSGMSLEIFEGKPGTEKMTEARDYFVMLADKVKNSYGTEAVSSAYNKFKNALDDSDFRAELGIDGEVSTNEKTELFKRAFDLVVPEAERWDFENDFFSFFIETVKEIYMPVGETNTEIEEICPYCDGEPKRMAKTDFFGPRSSDTEGYVWACECGAYAVMDGGKVVGKLGDTMLHQKRILVRGALCELCIIAGMTCYESYRWFSMITGKKINSISDVEYLDAEECNLALRVHIAIKQKIKENNYEYPKNRGELLLFLTDGGRLVVCNAYGFQYGHLLIPTEVGVEGIRIFGKEGKQSISFSDGLQYEFKGNEFFVVHPSGKKEKYRMMPAQMRTELLNLTREDILAAKAG